MTEKDNAALEEEAGAKKTGEAALSEEAEEQTVWEAVIDTSSEIKKTTETEVTDNPLRTGIVAEQARRAFQVRCERATDVKQVEAIKNAFVFGLTTAEEGRGAGALLPERVVNDTWKEKKGSWDAGTVVDMLEGMATADLFGPAPARAIVAYEQMARVAGMSPEEMIAFHLAEINTALKDLVNPEEHPIFGLPVNQYVDYLERELGKHGFSIKEGPHDIPYFER